MEQFMIVVMLEQIQQFTLDYYSNYINIDNDISLAKIHKLFFNKHIYEPENEIETIYLGYYYREVEKNYELMKHYYLMAIVRGSASAMQYLGNYYHHVEKNYDLMKKYYLMAIEKGSEAAMNDLALYYYSEKNYELMKHYYLMAIEKGYIISMHNLGRYYERIEKNYDLMKEYYLLAIEKGNHAIVNHTISNILDYYKNELSQNNDIYDHHFWKLISIENPELEEKLPVHFKIIKKLYNILIVVWMEKDFQMTKNILFKDNSNIEHH